MIRRTFIEILSGLLVTRTEWPPGNPTAPHPPMANPISAHSPATHPSATHPPVSHPPGTEPSISPWVSETDPEWLTDWLRLPRRPLLREDLQQIPVPGQRQLAAQILRRMRSGTPFPFLYFGGSDPGTRRQVLPVMLFTTAADTAPCQSELGPVYLLAWCQSRNAPRTFRLDRMRTDALSPFTLSDNPLS